ncbi:MAG TPA: RpiB/LacA/LacB family sugar-phosphate isomerase [Patescibacteria group bacterium]
MKVYLGTDHAGFELKEKVKKYLTENGYTVEDCGAFSFDKNDDYPDFISKVGEAISKTPTDRGIVFGGSGQAEAMLANKYKNVRAALFYAPRIPPHAIDANGNTSQDPFEMLRLTREHNDSNILSIGARLLTEQEALKAISLWLTTPFPGDSRHVRRIEKMAQIEQKI